MILQNPKLKKKCVHDIDVTPLSIHRVAFSPTRLGSVARQILGVIQNEFATLQVWSCFATEEEVRKAGRK